MGPVTGYTDYPSGSLVRKLQVLRYDNNKYAQVLFEDGTEESIKRGYIRRDVSLKRPIRAVDWHVLGGGIRHEYKRRSRKTEFTVFCLNRESPDARPAPKFDTQAEAVAYGVELARRTGREYLVDCDLFCHNQSLMGYRNIHCFPTGEAVVVYDYRLRKRTSKYLRGYGKFRGRQERLR